MFDFLKTAATAATPPVSAPAVLVRLLMALVLGWIVSWIYRHTRGQSPASKSIQTTLVLLAILIAAVTQVVGDNAARAFSLVGALSIIRFRTVVQDTQDTAFVIFAVVMGMAAGANTPWIALMGVVVVGGAAFIMRTTGAAAADGPAFDFTLRMRVGLGHDVEALVAAPFAEQLSAHRMLSMETVQKGTAVEVSYGVQFKSGASPEGLVKSLNRLEGVGSVQLEGADLDDD